MRKLVKQLNAILEATMSQMDSGAFCEALKKKLKIGNKYFRCSNYNQYNKSYNTVLMTFVNLSSNDPKTAGGANEMNNRWQAQVTGFGRELGAPAPTGKVKGVETSTALVFKEAKLKMRGKTAPPEKMADYIANFINKLAKTEPRIR